MSKDMIEKLQHISALENEREELVQYVKNGCDEETDNAVREVELKLKKQSPATKKMQDAYVELPKKLEEIPTFNGFFKLLGIGYVIAALFGLIFIPEGKVLYFILITIVAGFLTFKQWKKVQNKDQIIEQRNQQYEKDLDAYRQAIAEYKSHLEEMEQQLPKYEAAYRQAFPKCLQIYSDGEKRKAAAKEKLDACTSELNEKNFVGNAYLYLVDDIIHLLQSGRADDYKEALNIAIEEDRQRKLEEKRAEEERRRAEEAKRAADKAEADRLAVGYNKCMNCINSSKCSEPMKISGAGLTCGSFSPR